MPENEHGFKELTQRLTDDERKNLLTKIKSKDNENELDENGQNTGAKQNEYISNRSKILIQEYKKYSFLDKIIITIKAIFSGKSKSDVIVEKKFNTLKDKINKFKTKFVDIQNSHFTISFAEKLLKLYSSVHEMKNILSVLFKNKENFNRFIFHVLDRELTDEQRKLKKELFSSNYDASTNQVDEVKIQREMKKKMENFLKLFAASNFNWIKIQFETLEKLWILMCFNFKNIFMKFNPNISNQDYDKMKLNPVPFSAISSEYQYLSGLLLSIDISPEKLSLFNRLKNFKLDDHEFNEMEYSEDDIKKINQLSEEIMKLRNEIPLLSISRLLKKDIFYIPPSPKVQVKIKEVYQSIFKNKFSDKYNSTIKNITVSKIKNKLDYLIPNYDFSSLENYNHKKNNNIYNSMNIKGYSKCRNLNFLYKFLVIIFDKKIEPVLNNMIIYGTFIKELDKKKISNIYYILKSLIREILSFDKNLSDEGKDGKRLIYFIKNKMSNPKTPAYIAGFIKETDENADELLGKGIEAIKHLRYYFSKIISGEAYNIVSNISELKFNKVDNVDNMLKEIYSKLTNFIEVYEKIDILIN